MRADVIHGSERRAGKASSERIIGILETNAPCATSIDLIGGHGPVLADIKKPKLGSRANIRDAP